MNDEAALARNTMLGAISSGSAYRCCGVSSIQWRQPGGQSGQVGVGEAGTALGHRAEDVGGRVVGGQQQ